MLNYINQGYDVLVADETYFSTNQKMKKNWGMKGHQKLEVNDQPSTEYYSLLMTISRNRGLMAMQLKVGGYKGSDFLYYIDQIIQIKKF